MKFGPLALAEAGGAVLAHTVRWPGGAMRKGVRLTPERIDRLRRAGVVTVMAARVEAGDLHEDEAAARVAAALVPDPEAQGLRPGPARHGRVNLFARLPGILQLAGATITGVNRVSEAVAIATLPALARVAAGQLVATVKIIPFALPATVAAAAERAIPATLPALQVRGVRLAAAELVVTRGRWTPSSLPARGVEAIRSRTDALGLPLHLHPEVEHAEAPIAAALVAARAATPAVPGDTLLLVLGDTVTSDREDVVPRALLRAGGRILRFGMPVDPGNLLLLGELDGRPVIVLPGCARSPKLNGADWVLERIACGVPAAELDIAGMGVGGLLHEIASRPAPRLGGATLPAAPRISILLLAAGASRRMQGGHKLLREVDGVPLATRVAARLAGSRAGEIVAVVGAEGRRVAAALARAGPVRILSNPSHGEGIGASIRAGMAAIGAADAVVIALADMPEVGAAEVDRLIAAHDPAAGAGICRLVGPSGEPGHPVLFGRRYFEALAQLSGDRGARELLHEHPGDVADLPAPASRFTDLDTQADWQRWLAGRPGEGVEEESGN